MKTKRVFIEPVHRSDSYIRVSVDEDTGGVDLKLSDCDRRIWWSFGKPGDKHGIRKIKIVKAIVDEIYEYLAK